MTPSPEFRFQHLPAQQRFTLSTTPESVLDYELQPGRVVFTHTIVPGHYQGQGLAARLVEAGLAWARDQQLKVVPALARLGSLAFAIPTARSSVGTGVEGRFMSR